jgi:hypothetical protein
MASPAPVVALVGMAALRRDLNRLSTDTSGPLFAGIKQAGRAAADPVAAAARGRVPVDSGDLRGDIRVSATKTGATVRMGRVAVPYAGWIEFGGARWDGYERPYQAGGRYLFPAASDLATVAAEKYERALTQVFARSDIWTNTTTDGSSIRD